MRFVSSVVTVSWSGLIGSGCSSSLADGTGEGKGDASTAFDDVDDVEGNFAASEDVDNALGWQARAGLDSGGDSGARGSTGISRSNTYLCTNGCP